MNLSSVRGLDCSTSRCDLVCEVFCCWVSVCVFFGMCVCSWLLLFWGFVCVAVFCVVLFFWGCGGWGGGVLMLSSLAGVVIFIINKLNEKKRFAVLFRRHRKIR